MEHIGRKTDPLNVGHHSTPSKGKLEECLALGMVGGSKAPRLRRARKHSSRSQSEAPFPQQMKQKTIKYGLEGKTGSPAGICLLAGSCRGQTAACRKLHSCTASLCLSPCLRLALSVLGSPSPPQLLQLTATLPTLFPFSPLAS